MKYNKIIKLASYFKGKDIDIYLDLLKLASTDKLLALVLGSYPSYGGNQNEMNMRKNLVAKMIDRSDLSIYDISDIIEENPKILGENHSQVWEGYLSKKQIDDLLLILPKVKEDIAAPDSGPTYDFKSLCEKLDKIMNYHNSIKRAVEDLIKLQFTISRYEDGSSSIGKVAYCNPFTKKVRVFSKNTAYPDWGYEKIDLSLKDLYEANIGMEGIEPLVWLMNCNFYPFSIERTSGGFYEGCLLTKVSCDENQIRCTFNFIDDNFRKFTTLQKIIDIDPSSIASFCEKNKSTLNAF